MPKGRMTALDVRAMVADVAPCVKRLRVANVYDISSKVYVLKLSEADTKRHLVCEAGARFHLSEWKRDKQSIPSVFTMRLRKFLRTKRLTAFSQLGADRVIDMQFGLAENAMHLIIEFYARGNVVLTDHEYTVRATWRQFKADEALAVRVSQKYPVEEYMKETKFVATGVAAIKNRDDAAVLSFLEDAIKTETERIQKDPKTLKKIGTAGGVPLTTLIGRVMPVAHQKLIEQHSADVPVTIVTSAQEALPHVYAVVDRLLKVWESVSLPGMLGGPVGDTGVTAVGDTGVTAVGDTGVTAVGDGSSKMTDSTEILTVPPSQVPIKGYIYTVGGVNEEYSPLPLLMKPGWSVREFESFHRSVDEFYSALEVLRTEKAQSERVNTLESRIDNIRRDQFDRVAKLQRERDLAELQATAVEGNLEIVGRALEMVRAAVNSGSDWSLIEKMMKEQRKLGHPLATYIQKMNLRDRKFTFLVSDVPNYEDADSDGQLVPVELNVDLTAFANVEALHAAKKAANLKFQRTEEAAQRVIQAAEQAAAKERERKAVEVETRPPLQRLRKVFWFEKFHWFISSDNYLVLAGHDATQNEILYRKYLRRHDIYVHAEVHGAATCIIRNLTGGPVPQRTIEEAGQMSVCRSNAWKTKVLVQAYWVHAHQVSKTPQPGEYVSTGGFIIRGKRNPILVKKLEMGIGLLFHLGDTESINRHRNNDDANHLSSMPDSNESLPKLEVAQAPVEGTTPAPVEGTTPAPMEGTTPAPSPSEGASPSLAPSNSEGESRQEVVRRPSLRSGRPLPLRAVQFGEIRVMPTPTIQPRVEFDDLPPEVIVVHSERSILSDDEDHALLSGVTRSDDDEFEPPSSRRSLDSSRRSLDSSRRSLDSSRRSFDSRRPDSADELSPPSDYRGKAAPKELLAHRTPETMTVESDDDRTLDPPYTLEPFKISPLSARRSRVVDGGPLPRGFLEDEVPLPKTLLQLGHRLISRRPSDHTDDEHDTNDHHTHHTSLNQTHNTTSLEESLEQSDMPVDDTQHESGHEDDIQNHSDEIQNHSDEIQNHSDDLECDDHSPGNERKQRLSKAARRRMKRGNEGPVVEAAAASPKPAKPKSAPALSRAKLKKMKKIKQKYQEQSDEEREIALQLIGAKKLKEETEVEQPQPQPLVKKENQSPYNPQPDRNLAEENSDDEEEDNEWKNKRQDQLHELTGRPVEADTILFALPVCAPFSAVQSYLYKGKLTPGGGKKGHAVNLIHRAFVELTPANSIQRQLVKAITADELSAVLVASPNVDIEGSKKIQKQERKDKKAFSRAVTKASKG